MIQPRTLYAWDADRDRRLVCVAEAPFDNDGEDLMLVNGMSLDPGVTINLELPRKGAVADFLYSPTLHLFVSERAIAVIRRANVPQMRTQPVVLRDRVGRALDETYSWINVMPSVALLDRERSVFTEREYGGGIKPEPSRGGRAYRAARRSVSVQGAQCRRFQRTRTLAAIHVTGALQGRCPRKRSSPGCTVAAERVPCGKRATPPDDGDRSERGAGRRVGAGRAPTT